MAAVCVLKAETEQEPTDTSVWGGGGWAVVSILKVLTFIFAYLIPPTPKMNLLFEVRRGETIGKLGHFKLVIQESIK